MTKSFDHPWKCRPVYEIIKVLKDKVFIVGLGYDEISLNLEVVYEELNKQFPNKRIIYTDDIGEEANWYELIENMDEKDDSSPTGYEMLFCQYIGPIPKIKGWDSILKHAINLPYDKED